MYKIIILSVTSFISALAGSDLAEALKKPLIVGASVSADWGSKSPGRKLALRYTSAQNIKSISQGGRRGVDTVKLIKESDLEDRTIVIGIDLFFWDSTQASAKNSIEALHSFMNLVSSKNLPVVLGEIPELLVGRQPTRKILNSAIHKACNDYKNCRLMPFDQMHQQLTRDGYFLIYGKKFTLSDIVPDGLHLSEEPGNYFADVMRDLLQK